MQRAICPSCREEVISKCGSIKVWHWSHKADNDCDSWGEGETEWHINWKNEFPKEWQEVVIGKHRADIKLPSGKVIELQNSSISAEDIQERELFYGNMGWLFNGKTFAKNINLKFHKRSYMTKDVEIKNHPEGYVTFRWKHPIKSLWNVKKPLYIELNNLKYEEFQNAKHSKLISLAYEERTSRDDGSVTEDIKEYYHWKELCAMNFGNFIPNFTPKKYILNAVERLNEEEECYNGNNKILLIKKIYPTLPCGGWGILMTKEEFLKQFK